MSSAYKIGKVCQSCLPFFALSNFLHQGILNYTDGALSIPLFLQAYAHLMLHTAYERRCMGSLQVISNQARSFELRDPAGSCTAEQLRNLPAQQSQGQKRLLDDFKTELNLKSSHSRSSRREPLLSTAAHHQDMHGHVDPILIPTGTRTCTRVHVRGD